MWLSALESGPVETGPTVPVATALTKGQERLMLLTDARLKVHEYTYCLRNYPWLKKKKSRL